MRGKLRDKRSTRNGLTNHEENALRRSHKRTSRNVQWIDLEMEEEEYDDELDDLATDDKKLAEENEIVVLPPRKKSNINPVL